MSRWTAIRPAGPAATAASPNDTASRTVRCHFEKFVHQTVVEIEALGVRRTRSLGKHPRPRDRKSIGLGPQFPDQPDVFLVAVIVVVGAVGVAAIRDLARRMRKGIPDRTTAAVFIDGAFDLIRGSRGAPYKTFREAARRVAVARGLTSSDFAGMPPSRARKNPQAWQSADARIYRTSPSPVRFACTGWASRRLQCQRRRLINIAGHVRYRGKAVKSGRDTGEGPTNSVSVRPFGRKAVASCEPPAAGGWRRCRRHSASRRKNPRRGP